MKSFFLAALLAVSAGTTDVIAKAPYVDPASDPDHFGAPDKILFWTPEQQVASYRNIDKIFPTRTIIADGAALELPEALVELGDVPISTENSAMTLNEYFVQQNVAGLLVIKDGKIAYERYGLGNTPDSRWISFSVTKSVVSMLVGAAIHDGYIDNVDEMVSDYLPRLKGSPYDQSTIRNIMQMSSGVEWNEDYADPASDVNSASWQTVALYDYLGRKHREAAPGTFGMEADGYWTLTEPGGGEFGGCCINATLRDYGRLGLFALAEGRLADGTAVLPDGWMTESTAPSAAYPGYGYLWWLGNAGAYRAIGIFGQGICIHPEQNVVVALHSARAVASADEDWALQSALCGAVANALGG